MPENSETNLVRRKAGETPEATPERLLEIESIADLDIDQSDIREMADADRLHRDENGQLPSRRSPVREAIIAAMDEKGWTAYRLWREARPACSTLSQSTVRDFLKGRKIIGTNYAEALMAALGLVVTREKR